MVEVVADMIDAFAREPGIATHQRWAETRDAVLGAGASTQPAADLREVMGQLIDRLTREAGEMMVAWEQDTRARGSAFMDAANMIRDALASGAKGEGLATADHMGQFSAENLAASWMIDLFDLDTIGEAIGGSGEHAWCPKCQEWVSTSVQHTQGGDFELCDYCHETVAEHCQLTGHAVASGLRMRYGGKKAPAE